MDDIFPYIEYVSSIGIVYTAEIAPVPEIIPDVSNALFASAEVWMYTWKNSAFISNISFISSINNSPIFFVESCIALIPSSSGFLSMLINMHD